MRVHDIRANPANEAHPPAGRSEQGEDSAHVDHLNGDAAVPESVGEIKRGLQRHKGHAPAAAAQSLRERYHLHLGATATESSDDEGDMT